MFNNFFLRKGKKGLTAKIDNKYNIFIEQVYRLNFTKPAKNNALHTTQATCWGLLKHGLGGHYSAPQLHAL